MARALEFVVQTVRGMAALLGVWRLWHLVCQKQSCQAIPVTMNAENKPNLTRWYLVCQKYSGFILLIRHLLLEEISRARTETDQGATHHG